jgi:hypothetical protein
MPAKTSPIVNAPPGTDCAILHKIKFLTSSPLPLTDSLTPGRQNLTWKGGPRTVS